MTRFPESLDNVLREYSKGIAVGLLASMVFGVVALTQNRQLMEDEVTLERRRTALEAKAAFLEELTGLQQACLGIRLVKTPLGNRAIADSLRGHSSSLLIFIAGGCSSCFETELHIWNHFAAEAESSNVCVLGVNLSLQDAFVQQLAKSKSLTFRVITLTQSSDHELLKGTTAQVVAALVDSNMIVRRIHLSQRGNTQATESFCSNVLQDAAFVANAKLPDRM
jgi:hypothetical protein